MTIDDLRKNVEKQFLVGQVQRDEVGSKLSITEEEARQYYLTHKNRLRRTRDRHASRDPHRGAADDQGRSVDASASRSRTRPRQQAAALRTRILAGEDFAKVAAEASAAPSKANGGLIGPINLAEVSPSLQEMIQKMKPGEITPADSDHRGVQILKLETTEAGSSIPPFESVRDLVADKVHDARQQAEVRKFLSRVRGQALIEWKNDELKKLYEKQVALDTGGGAD